MLKVSLNPVRVLKEEAGEEKAETARLSSFVGAMAVGELVKSTLGPKGMDKILWGMGRNEGQVRFFLTALIILQSEVKVGWCGRGPTLKFIVHCGFHMIKCIFKKLN